MGNKVQGTPETVRPVVVYHGDQVGKLDDSQRLRRLIPAWIISGIIHVLLLAAFLFVNVSNASDTAVETDTAVFDTKVDDNTPPPNLENEDIGLDPDLQTNYNVKRIEEISVPGPVNASENVGIVDSPDGPPMTLPPPPGVGGNVGTGGAIDDPNRPGTGNLIGIAGGLGGPKALAGGFSGRSGATRQQMVAEGGGNTASEAAVAQSLKWFVSHQATDGHWSLTDFHHHGKCNCSGHVEGAGNDIAATAFGLLPLLGAGQTHKAGTDKGNKYTKEVDRALKYLLLKQSREGVFHPNMYAQGLATIAVCEAYALTSDPALRGPAQRAINHIAAAQSAEGGWRYEAHQPGHDTSVGGWQIMALKSGQMAGLDVPTKTLENASKKWLDDVANEDGSKYGYVTRDNDHPTLWAVGLLCREYLGWGPRHPGLIQGVKLLLNMKPQPNNIYYNYYATQVMHHMGGEAWKTWNEKMRDQLINTQDKGDKNPHQKGSWFNDADAFAKPGGRIMDSSLSVLTLEVYYRHLPLYRRDVGGDKALMDK